jgi:hypothetical protein
MGKKKKILLATIIVLCIVLLLFILNPKPKTTNINTLPEYISEAEDPLLYRVEPPPGEVEFGSTRIGASIFFNYPIDLGSLDIETNPQITLIPKMLPDFPERVILEPASDWQANVTYTITIKKGVRAKGTENIQTDEDITIQYRVLETDTEIENYHPAI